jgi:two-component system sensor histidine kinase CpxA
MFLMRGAGGDGYWAGVRLHISGDNRLPPHPALLLIRSDRLDGAGMFFDLMPWLWGGLAVLGLSVVFWTPFFLSITRYLQRLTHATDLIASGQFQVSLPHRSDDELRVLGRAVESMAARLDHLVSGQKRFLGDAAHELCGPIARLRTGLGILEMKLRPEERESLVSIESDAEELAALVEEILAFSRAGGRKPRWKSVSLVQLAKDVVSREAPNQLVEIQISHELEIKTDPTLFARAMGNVVRNSVTHAGPGARIIIRANEWADHVGITITDNGPGVPSAELSHIFEPFYRPDSSRTRETGGSGLGLAIVRTAMEVCGGTAEAFIPANGGFSVTLTLPFNRDLKK